MISRRSLFVPALALAASCRRKRGDGFNGYAFVANEDGHAIAAVDLTAFAVARHIRLDGAPTDVLAHDRRPLIYALTPASGMLYEIDGSTLAVKRRLFVGGPATSMRKEPGGQALWILSGPGKKLLRVAFEELRVSSAVSLPNEPIGFDLSEWTGLAAVHYGPAGSLSLIELKTSEVSPTVNLGGDLGPMGFRSDGKALLIGNRAARQLSVIDAPKGRIMTHLPLAVRPDHFCFHPNGGQVFITGEGRDAVVVAYPYYVPEIAETVLAGNRPGSMCATEAHLFVTNPEAGDVSIFNISRRRLLAVAAVGANPSYITVTPDKEYALVLNRNSGDMAVIRIAGLQPDAPVRRKSAALFTMIPVGSKPVSAVVKEV